MRQVKQHTAWQSATDEKRHSAKSGDSLMVLLIHSTTLFGIAHQLLLSASDAEHQGGSVLSLERRHTGVLSTDGGFVFIGDAYTYNALDLQWTCGPKRFTAH